MIFIKLAWRNLFRNKRRTLLAGIAIGIGLTALIFTDALTKGMVQNMVHSATASFMGEGQIHHAEFLSSQDTDLTIRNRKAIVESLRVDPVVKNFTQRVLTFGMISSPANLQSVSLVGVDPEQERHLSQIDEAMSRGSYFTGSDALDIIIGAKMAELLEAGIGDRVVATVAEARSGSLSQAMFRVSGVFKFGVDELDGGIAFIRLQKAQEMLALGDDIHEIAINFENSSIARSKDTPFWSEYSKYGNDAQGWIELQPQLATYMDLTQYSTYLVGLILFGVVALGIINTLFMSLHERMFEFGVLRAVGTRPVNMGFLILCEAAALSIVSIVLGTIMGFLLTYITSLIGIDYTGIEMLGVTIRELLYPEMTVRQFIEYPFWVFVFTTTTGLYPAWTAARMQPADAMKRSF